MHTRKLRKVAEADDEYQQLKEYVLNGFLDHHHVLHDCCRHYWQACQHLSIDDGLLTLGYRLIIPLYHHKGVITAT